MAFSALQFFWGATALPAASRYIENQANRYERPKVFLRQYYRPSASRGQVLCRVTAIGLLQIPIGKYH